MTFQRRLLTLLVVLAGLALLGLPPGARAADEATHAIPPSLTDPAIADPPPPSPSRGDNLVWLAPENRRVGKLLVFLPTGGPTNLPSEFTELGTVAGRLGYHTIILAYRNEAPIAALPTANPPGCGAAEQVPAGNTCARDARLEILDGMDESTVVNVDRANSIENRLNKLLVYLKDTFPEEGWAQFLDASGLEPDWSETVIAGSSLGAGEAAMIAQRHDVFRVALLHGWVDARHGWVTRGATPTSDYFTLIHQRDNFFGRTCYAYLALGLTQSCPLTDFPVVPAPSCPANFPDLPVNPLWIENRQPPFGIQLHVFNLKPGSFEGTGDWCHQSTSRNGWIAREDDGITPSRILVSAWSSVLGDETDGDGVANTADNCPGTANPAQADADLDGIGDICDRTPQGTTPPTLLVPGHITANATGPAGAILAYAVTATDDIDPHPSVTCAPSAGTLFAIGDTPVGCTATDSGANAASASFVVTVLGAKAQLANLITSVVSSTRLPAAIKTQLTASLQALVAGLDPSRPLQRAAVCVALRVFATRAPFLAPPAQAAQWTTDANRIRAVLAC